MNLTNRLSSTDLTTLARVKEFIASSFSDVTQDSIIASAISDVSRRFVEYLKIHATAIERTEVYRVRKFARTVTLDGTPIDTAQTFEVQIGFNDTEWANVTIEDRTSFSIHAAGGFIEFVDSGTTVIRRARLVRAANYVRVKYTGGLGADTAAIVAAFPDVALACDMQTKYLIERRMSLGGNVTTGQGGATEFQGEYMLLKDVRAALDTYARRAA